MFNIVALFLPNFIKGKIPSLLKYGGYALIVAAISTVAFFSFKYFIDSNNENKRIQQQQLIDKAQLIVEQENKIREQQRQIAQATQAIEELKQSHEQTLASVNALKQEQKKIQGIVVKKKQIIEKEFEEIDSLGIPEVDKDAQKSLALITGLNDTYQSLFGNQDKVEVN